MQDYPEVESPNNGAVTCQHHLGTGTVFFDNGYWLESA